MSKSKALKQQEAKARQELRNKKSIKDQLNVLDAKFGKDLGAIKERSRLNNILNKKEEVVEESNGEEVNVTKTKKKSKKKNEK